MTSVSGGLEFLPEVASEEDALFPLETQLNTVTQGFFLNRLLSSHGEPGM